VHTNNPQEEQFIWMDHFLHYVAQHKADALHCDPPVPLAERRSYKPQITICSDAELGHNEDGKCVFGYCISLDRLPIVTSTFKSATCPNDTCFAEAIAAYKSAIAGLFWARCLQEVGILDESLSPIRAGVDNMSVVNVATQNTGFIQVKASSHIRLKVNFIHSLNLDGLLQHHWVFTDYNFSDLTTKTLDRFKNAIFSCRMLNLAPAYSTFQRVFGSLAKRPDATREKYFSILRELFPLNNPCDLLPSEGPSSSPTSVHVPVVDEGFSPTSHLHSLSFTPQRP